MRKYGFVALLLLAVWSIAGCGSGGGGHAGMDMSESMMDPVQVDLSWTPEQAKVGNQVTIEVNVTQKDKQVDKADEVMIEISKEGDSSSHEKVAAQNAGGGKYTLDKTFDQAGTYSITSHVTVGPQHTMPTKKLTVTE
ncbi:FixH family protein [Paenibacillus favisporus]|uniref:FixH family protein n=1 Tax=Paenibacillus favisporus TaxID=221028 RepID=UPI003D2AE3A9